MWTAKAKSTAVAPFGSWNNAPLGGEGEDPILIDREARVFEQLLGIVALFDDLDQIAQPAHLPVGLVSLLVGPVRRQPEFVAAVHFARANLDFDPHRILVHQGRCASCGSHWSWASRCNP